MERIVLDTNGRNKRNAPMFTLVVVGIIAVVFLTIMGNAWRSIRPGYVGIVFDKANHKVTTGRLDPGWAFINPFTQAIQEYPVTIQTYSMVQSQHEGQVIGDDSIKIQSNEGQQLNLDVVIQYQVKKEEAGLIYQDWGGASVEAVQSGIIRQYTRSQVPVIASKYGWEEVTSSKRGEVVDEIAKVLSDEFTRRHLQLISFGIREVHLPASLQGALEQKMQAQQSAEKQKYQLQQAKVKAEQDVAEATGEANAIKAKAEGEATAILTRANAQSEANKKLAESVTPELIKYQSIQRWDGKLPLITGGQVPLVDVSKLVDANGK